MLGKRIVSPSLWRTPTYDSFRPETRDYRFSCITCGAEIALDLEQLLSGAADAETLLGTEHVNTIKAHFDFNLVGKAHDGGWPRLQLASCPACCTQYIIYLGVQEPTNSHVLVTVEGITEWQA